MKNPNYRETDNCTNCTYCKLIFRAACCSAEYYCKEYGKMVFKDMTCDSFEKEEG